MVALAGHLRESLLKISGEIGWMLVRRILSDPARDKCSTMFCNVPTAEGAAMTAIGCGHVLSVVDSEV